jgi:hypothetical protein
MGGKMITPSFGLTATERVLPKLALDFTTASLDPRVTFTRAGNTATVVNSSGYVVPINADLPRFDFNPTTLACNGLLIEESRTNLMTYSSDFADVSWIPLRASVTSNATTAPDNTLTADKLVEDTTAVNSHLLYKGPFILGTYTYTVFAKAGERSTLQIQQESGGNSRFLLTGNGTATALGANTVSITPFGNGWYRCTTTFTATGTFFIYSLLNDGTSIFYTGDGTSGLFLWGAQVELASFPTSYIPTVASQVTRTADVATMTGTNFSDWYNQTQGAFVVESLSCAAANARFISVTQTLSGLTPDNTIYIDAVGNVRGVVYSGSTAVAVMLSGARPALGTLTRCSLAYAVDNYAASLNGATPATDTSGALPVVANTQLEIGQVAGGFATTSINSHMRKIFYWPQRLINAEVQAFTK